MNGCIALDMTPAITGRTGIARYVVELAAALRDLDDAPELRPFAIGRATVPPSDDVRHVRVPLRVVDAAWRWTRQPTIERITGPVASVHASGPVLPPSRRPIVAVVHDLAAVEHPELHPARDVAQLRRYLAGLDRADAVVAVSRTTAQRLAESGVAPDRIHVTHNGRTPLPPPVAPPLAGRTYVLAVGAPVPRKDFATLVRALPHLDDDVTLVIAGPPGSDDDALVGLARDAGVASRLHRAGHVSDAELAGWYHHAAAVAAPSIEEGFGLTVVEALAQRVPAVVTDLPVFREVTGGHARFVPVGDADALAHALREAIDRTAAVDDDVERGAAHVAGYTWTACASATLAVHRAVTQG